MLLQTNSYIVPREKRAEHARLLRRFRQTLLRLGCDHFEVYEQVGANWNTGETTGRFVQIMRFRDRKHQLSVQAAERTDPTAQTLVQEFCDLINFPYQQQQGLFAVGFYTSFLRMPPQRTTAPMSGETSDATATEPGTYADSDAAAPPPGDFERPMSIASAENPHGEDDGSGAYEGAPPRSSPAYEGTTEETGDDEGALGEDEDDAPLSDEELRRAQSAIDQAEETEGGEGVLHRAEDLTADPEEEVDDEDLPASFLEDEINGQGLEGVDLNAEEIEPLPDPQESKDARDGGHPHPHSSDR